MMAARILFTCAVERSGGSQGAVCYALRTGVVVARMLYAHTVERSDGCQNAVLMHCGQEWWQPAC